MASHGALPIAFAVLLCSSFLLTQCTVVAASVSSLSSHEQEQEQEIRRLRSKVASLEDEVSGRKEETSQLESLVREKTAQIAALVGGLEVLQVTNVADDESVMKASTNSAMLEEQIERLGNDLEDQVKKGESLEARASEAEKSLLELGQKLEHVEKINIEQRKKIEELEHHLQNAEGQLSEGQTEAKLKAEELAMDRGMWLPYWFASRSEHCQELASVKWRLHGKPAVDALMQKVVRTLTHAQRLVEPHLQATQNVQEGIRRFLLDNELLKLNPLSAHRLAWWTASAALFALPVYFVYKIFSATIWKKIQARGNRGRGGRFSRRKPARRVGK
ncbi:uncharacterized protein LOC100846177 isoform X1 [Brachypodium distachyon]|uniref:Transmembrane protein n=1 Tax=Brachypodium distachyon TaxID=15368 RepID=I1J1J4_BRADI|nr:uncharacterized protein LOC100846177 isoform X1 [Brachypodium distachyon]KQJ84455.1 hypothetical protein BRADI_5g20990v3 [Brachypodium distachyon]|eukprot:XP_003581624.1 uncharacterized protein LOC100846177 isoform X1 [Brachypodium distachyon]